MRHATIGALFLTFLVGLGCSSAAPGPEATSAASLSQGTLEGGTWKTLQVSQTPGTISHHGRLAFLPSGEAVAVWSEPDQNDSSIQNIWAASLDGDTWSTSPPLTTNRASQNAFASMVPVGDVAHVVWNGYPGGDNDIFHSELAGGAWSARTDLTSGFKTNGNATTDSLPSMAASPKGGLAVAYDSSPSPDSAVVEIRVLRLDPSGAPLAAPTVAIPAPVDGSGCYGPSAEFDADGHLHVVAECGPIGAEHLVWGTDASGSWVVTPLDAVGASDVQAHLTRGAGRGLELVWTAFSACSSSGNACGDVVTATIEGTNAAPARHVTSTPDVNEVSPLAVVDKAGRLLVGYSHDKDTFLTWATDPQTFAPEKNLTAGTDATWELLSALAIDPVTGAPHVLYEQVLPGTQPLNAEIMHTFWVPDAR
jgi:hypothetical protein